LPSGEKLVAELAPELVPWLASLEQPANYVPITNEVLKETARRGVCRDKLLTTLQLLGAELPGATLRLLQWVKKQQLPVKVLSDCNSMFVSHILKGARLHGYVGEVITNAAAFEKVAASEVEGAGVGLGITSSIRKAPAGASYKLVIQPRHPATAAAAADDDDFVVVTVHHYTRNMLQLVGEPDYKLHQLMMMMLMMMLIMLLLLMMMISL
jgi:hypothetical protein